MTIYNASTWDFVRVFVLKDAIEGVLSVLLFGLIVIFVILYNDRKRR